MKILSGSGVIVYRRNEEEAGTKPKNNTCRSITVY